MMSSDNSRHPLHQPLDRSRVKAHANVMAFLDACLPSASDSANAMFPNEPPLSPMPTAEEVAARIEAGNRRCREAAKASFDLYAERFLEPPHE